MAANQIYECEGIVHQVDDMQQFGDFFKKQSVILLKQSSYMEKIYEDYLTFDFVNQGINLITNLQAGAKVKISFVLQGKESKNEAYKGKFFNTLKAIKIQTLEDTSVQQRSQQTFVDSQEKNVNAFVGENKSLNPNDGPDDLPFALLIPLALGFMMNFFI